MGSNSAIEWTDHTFNPWRGCVQVADHPACDHCYAMTMSKRNPAMLGTWGNSSSGGTRVVAAESMWQQPTIWNTKAAAAQNAWELAAHPHGDDFLINSGFIKPIRPRVFCASLADVFEDWDGRIECGNELQPLEICRDTGEWSRGGGPYTNMRSATMHDVRRRLFALIDATPHLDWLLLTKRPENVWKFWPRWDKHEEMQRTGKRADQVYGDWYRHNVWIGTSIGDQATADKYVPQLLKCRDLASVLFLSIEPLLGPIDLRKIVMKESSAEEKARGKPDLSIDSLHGWYGTPSPDRAHIDWVIAGGESGAQSRPMHPDWVRSLRDQCTAAGVPFFFKQWGEWVPESSIAVDGSPFSQTFRNNAQCHFCGKGERLYRVGKKAAGRLLDGVEWNQFPAVSEVAR